jgi:hypothetical protein
MKVVYQYGLPKAKLIGADDIPLSDYASKCSFDVYEPAGTMPLMVIKQPKTRLQFYKTMKKLLHTWGINASCAVGLLLLILAPKSTSLIVLLSITVAPFLVMAILSYWANTRAHKHRRDNNLYLVTNQGVFFGIFYHAVVGKDGFQSYQLPFYKIGGFINGEFIPHWEAELLELDQEYIVQDPR